MEGVTELSGGGFLLDLQGVAGELEQLRQDFETYPYEGQLGVQGAGGQSSTKRTVVPDDSLVGEVLEVMLATLPEGPWAVEWWMNRTPETAAIGAHAHRGEWSGLLYVGLPEDPAPLEFVGRRQIDRSPAALRREFGFDPGSDTVAEVEESVEVRVGRLIVWPANRLHAVEARPAPEGREPGHRLALVFNAARVVHSAESKQFLADLAGDPFTGRIL